MESLIITLLVLLLFIFEEIVDELIINKIQSKLAIRQLKKIYKEKTK